MSSNALSKRGQILRRPKVCLPPLPATEEKSGIRCTLRAVPSEQSVDEFVKLFGEACNQNLGRGEPVEITVDTELSEFDPTNPPQNCDPELEIGFLANLGGPGLEIVKVTYTFLDGSTCSVSVTVLWT